jgi:hypothetical protein
MLLFIAVNHATLPVVSSPMNYAVRGSECLIVAIPGVERSMRRRCFVGETG